LFGQRKTELNTNGQGTLFGQFGYNRSAYTKANVPIQSDLYHFTLEGVRLSDNKEGKGLDEFFSDSSPQFSVKLGYFFKNRWAVTLNFDRYNTFFKNNQNVQ